MGREKRERDRERKRDREIESGGGDRVAGGREDRERFIGE